MMGTHDLGSYTGSLWRDYNDHVFRLGAAHREQVDSERDIHLIGIMMHCPDWCQMPHHLDGQFYECWASEEELKAGEIFGWSRVA